MKSVCIRNFSGQYLFQRRENTDRKNSEYGHFSRNVIHLVGKETAKWPPSSHFNSIWGSMRVFWKLTWKLLEIEENWESCLDVYMKNYLKNYFEILGQVHKSLKLIFNDICTFFTHAWYWNQEKACWYL